MLLLPLANGVSFFEKLHNLDRLANAGALVCHPSRFRSANH